MISRWLSFLILVSAIWLIAISEGQRIWAPFLVVLLGWAICELYARIKRKITYRNYIGIIAGVFFIPFLWSLFLPRSQSVSDMLSLLVGLFGYSLSVFSLFVEKKPHLVAENKNNDHSLGAL